MSLYYVKSCSKSYLKEYKKNISNLLWNSLLLVRILYKGMIKKELYYTT
jgi:hypothetical protein